VFNDLPQFVKQEVCLNCDGCCRFKDGEQAWHAKIGIDEIYELRRDQPSLAGEIFQPGRVTLGGFLESRPLVSSGCRCVFFDDQQKKCSIYPGHPFECRLYPFVIRRRGAEIVLSCHLACPFIQDHFDSPAYHAYVDILNVYFQRPDVLEFIRVNPHIPGNYDAYSAELYDVMTLSGVRGDEGLMGWRWSLEHALLNARPSLAGQSFAALALWTDFFEYRVLDIQGAVCVFAEDAAGCFMPIPPLGKQTPAVVDECFARMRERNGIGGVSRIENVSAAERVGFQQAGYATQFKAYEACYFREDLEGYRGNAYRSRRAGRNHFIKNYRHDYRPFTETDTTGCLELFDRWRIRRQIGERNDAALLMLDDSRTVHARAMADFTRAGLIGRVVEIDGRIAGYTFGYALSPQVFCVALEIVDRDVKGLAEFLFHAFCCDEAVRSHAFINGMDSFALPGVEAAKMAYHPSILLASYTVTPGAVRGDAGAG
jgi:uncharacterized protein